MLADTISAEFLTKTIEHYLADEPQAVAVEDGRSLVQLRHGQVFNFR